ncbi:MAG: filamentous hemagglutinin N-terminal domain-containing protein, partial [Gallionellaceae bacterium]
MIRPRFPLKRLSLAALLALSVQGVHANPLSPTVANGQASFASSGNILTVTNTPGTIIHWQDFSIQANEVTRFAQQSAASTVLNRVTGANPSNILGSLQSNGRVFLINPNGILFGQGATVDVAGMLASTLNLSNTDFLAGRYRFGSPRPLAGEGQGVRVTNQGNITAESGGQIYLIAPNVENTGIINAPNGEILLAAGHSVELVDTGNPNLRINITAPAGDATNVGQLVASAGNLGLFGTIVKNSGTVNASSATLQGGKIVFKASQRTEIAGTVTANSTAPQPTPTLPSQGGSNTPPLTKGGGEGLGGTIHILGNEVGVMDGAKVSADGANGGGTILIGGDYQGKNPDIPNAQITYVAPTASISADGGTTSIPSPSRGGLGWGWGEGIGNGGKVIVWSDNTTQFSGNISARGGAKGGNGGWVEVSGKQTLNYMGLVDTSAAKGQMGSLLLDPMNITISTAVNTASMAWTAGTLTYADPATAIATSNLNVTTLQTQLALTNVTVDTTGGGLGTGIITVSSPVAWAANKLTLNALTNININAAMTGTGTASLALQYGQGALAAGNASTYNVNAAINLPAGANFSTKLGSNGVLTSYTVITSLGVAGDATVLPATMTLQGMNMGLAGNYVLGANIDATTTNTWNVAAGFVPVGNAATNFTGTFDGLNHTISNLTINRPTVAQVGLFGNTAAGAVVQNVGLVGVNISGQGSVGSLVGANQGTVTSSYATGSVTGSGNDVGGLIGWNIGSVSKSNAAVTTTGAAFVGGLIGTTVNASGVVSNSYATGNVTGTDIVGGLVGINWTSLINNSYATGNVTATNVTGFGRAGGLAGQNYLTGSISTGYATGAVTGMAGQTGGLIGWNEGTSTVASSFWDATTSGKANGLGIGSNGGVTTPLNGVAGVAGTPQAGVTGLTTAQFLTAASFTGFTFGTVGGTANQWVIVDADGTLNNAAAAAGATRPMLLSEYSTTISNSHQLQLMATNLAGSYTLGANVDATATNGTTTPTGVWGSAGFAPIGNATNFTGTLNGVGHSVNNLYINRLINAQGLFGTVGATGAVSNVAMVGGSISGSGVVGPLVANNFGQVANSYSSGITVNSTTGTGYAGGLVGLNQAGGSVTTSYSSASVSGDWGSGGLVGGNAGTISNSYATGSVTGVATTSGSGGLVATNYSTGSILTSYATGAVGGSGIFGGLVNNGQTGSQITNSFWNTQTTGQSLAVNSVFNLGTTTATGLTTAQMQQFASFGAWNTAAPNTISNTGGSTAVWRIYEGSTAPLLRSLLTPITLTPVYNGTVQTLTNVADYTASIASPATANIIQNGLTLTSSATAGTHTALLNVSSNQQGYDITTSAVTITGTGSTANNIVIANALTATNGTLILNATGSVNLTGSLTLTNGTVNVQTGGVTGTGTLNVSAGASSVGTLKAATLGMTGGSLTLAGVGSTTLTTLNFNPGTSTLSNAGTLNIGSLNVTGSLVAAATATLAGAGAVNLTGTGTINATCNSCAAILVVDGAGKVLTSSGTLTMTGSNVPWAYLYLANGAGPVVNGATGTWNLNGGQILAGAGVNFGFTNSAGGIFNAGAGTTTSGGTVDVAYTNSGTMNVNAGTLSVTGALTQSGTINVATGTTLAKTAGFTNAAPGILNGSGSIAVGAGAAALTNSGTINPGTDGTAGTLSITGDLVMAAGGKLNADLMAPTAGNYDVLSVSGITTLTNGT